MKKILIFSAIVIVLVILFFVFSGPEKQAKAPTLPIITTEKTVVKEAIVDSVDVLILESFPVQVRAVARGFLPDACTEVEQISKSRKNNRFEVSIKTVRSSEALCAQVLTPLEETISLEVYGLLAGTYIVSINGVEKSFELSVDNVLSPR